MGRLILSPQDVGPSTYRWINDRCIEHGQVNNLTIDYRAFGGPLIKVDGLPITERLCFDPAYGETPKLTLLFSDLDEVYRTALAENAGQVDVLAVCGLIQATCTGDLQEYDSVEDCVSFMNSIPHEFGPCPTSQDSNTVNCRFLHALVAALPDPESAERHCPHTARDSHPCMDHCLPACADCDENEHCENVSDEPTQPDYRCVCNVGYAATGRRKGTGSNERNECEPVECTQNENCLGRPGGVGICDQNTGLCGCKSGFKWDPIRGRCECPSETHFVSNEGPNAPECVPRGRCYTNQECSRHVGSHSKTVTCGQYGENPYAPWKTCICNPGFEGGFQYPCTCLNGRVVQSPILKAKVCIKSGECVRDADCPRNETCNIPEGAVIGTCSGHCPNK
jgi:hypothetical protein